LEELVGGPLPLSLRAWYEQVGSVSLLGYPSTLHFDAEVPVGDPLMIASLDSMLREMKEEWNDRENSSSWWQDGKIRLPLAPDDHAKEGDCGEPYDMVIPNLCADGIFEDGNKRTFVNYLRNAFAFGGFPGWKRKKQIREIVAN
jgi:hypothetical protein